MNKVGITRALLVVAAVAAGAAARPAQAQTGLQFYAVTPCRIYDSRAGTPSPLPASTQRNVTIKGSCNIPSTALAVSLNATIVSPTVDGFFSLWPSNGVFPVVSTLNFLAGEPALANGAIVPLAPATTGDLALAYGTASGQGSTHVVLDVTGYFQ
jgi:hypothetical protein